MSTFLLKKRGKYLTLPLQHLLTGITQVKYELLSLHPEKDFIVKRTYALLWGTIKLFQRKKKCVTVELVPKNKLMTLEDKGNFLNQDTLITLLLQTSVHGLIGNVKVLEPFWNDQCLEKSKKLWLPTVTDCVGLRSNLSNGFSNETMLNSLFLTKTIVNPKTLNYPMTFYPSSMSTHVETWEDEDILRTRNVRIYPTKNQKIILNKWLGTSRYVYNNGLNGIKNNNEKFDFYKLRNKYVTSTYNETPNEYLYDLFYDNDKFNYHVKDWELETPKDIRAESLRDLCKAYKTCLSNIKLKNIRKFNIGYRSKKKNTSMVIPKTALNIKGGKLEIYKRYIKSPIRLSKDKSLKNVKISHDCRISKKGNEFYILIPIPQKISTKNPLFDEACGIDPGVRKFNTVYSDKVVFTVELKKDSLKKLHLKLDNFNMLRSKKLLKESRIKRSTRKIYKRLDYCILDMHCSLINKLTKTFSKIYLPSFETQEIGKVNRNKKTRRNLFQQKHYSYKQRFIDKCKLLKNVELVICTEEYTSKTCTQCGHLNDIGSSEIYTCVKCCNVTDRDINGSRNILIKNSK